MTDFEEIPHYSERKYEINGNKGIIIGKSQPMRRLFAQIDCLSQYSTTVLIRGETGTGKELVAKALHYNGNGVRKGLFVPINCAGIPETLLESELFGYVKGAFTGAMRDRIGKFQYADGGTLFLDEIADMNKYLQAKILRVLQDKEITPVGSNESRKVNVRVVAATNKPLEEQVEMGNFREDLYYRLNRAILIVPPLRERKDDIHLMVDHFIDKLNAEHNRKMGYLSEDEKIKLLNYNWPGNVRELEAVIERIVMGIPADSDSPESIKDVLPTNTNALVNILRSNGYLPGIEEMNKALIEEALRVTNGNQAKAARLLKVTWRQFDNRVRRYDLRRLIRSGDSK